MKSVTILGCGVAGSWMAHLLADSGYDHFVLYDESDNIEHALRLGPYTNNKRLAETASEQLAHHLSKIDPSLKIEARGKFCPKNDLEAVQGVVVGAMGSVVGCQVSAVAVKEKGHQWVTFGIPSTAGGEFAIGTDPSVTTEDHYGVPNATKEQILLAAAQAINLIN